MAPRTRKILAAVGIFAMTFAAYTRVLPAEFIWDDEDYVTENRTLRDLNGLKRIWFEWGATTQYYPLVYTTFWVEYQIWGDNPVGYHVANVLLHAGVALLLWKVLSVLQVPGAWFAAAIFAVHPVCVESVAWITERKNVLSGLFYFSSAWAYLRFRGTSEAQEIPRRWGLYAISVALFAAALLSKTVTGSLPAALLLIIWWKRRRIPRIDLVLLVPLIVVGLGLGLSTAYMERTDVGAEGTEWDLSVVERFLLAGRALWFYAGKILIPHRLTFIYPRWTVDDRVWWSYLYPLSAIAVLLVLVLLRNRIGRGVLTGVLFFSGMLFPALGFANVYFFQFSFVADHFQYLAVPGLIALFAAGATLLVKCRNVPRSLCTSGAGVLLCALGVLTWRQSGIYKNQITLWEDTLKKNPTAWIAMNNLGCLVRERGETGRAIDLFNKCIAIKPRRLSARVNLAETYKLSGQYQRAIEQFTVAIDLEPRYPESYNKRGMAYAELGAFDLAIADYNASIALKPTHAEAYRNRGAAYGKKGAVRQAVADFTKAIEIDPYSSEAFKNRGLAYEQTGLFELAVADYDKAIALHRDYSEAYHTRGRLYGRMGRLDLAIRDLTEAIRLNADLANAYQDRAVVYQRMGRDREAIEDFHRVVQLQPDRAKILASLGWTLATHHDAELRNGPEAVRLAQRACQLTQYKIFGAIDTLAAAYAESGQFDLAVETASKALELALASGNERPAQEIRRRISLYKSGKPYHQTGPINAP